MSQITDKKVMDYINKVKKTFDAKVILFGSRAKGNALLQSDYDLCIISDNDLILQ